VAASAAWNARNFAPKSADPITTRSRLRAKSALAAMVLGEPEPMAASYGTRKLPNVTPSDGLIGLIGTAAPHPFSPSDDRFGSMLMEDTPSAWSEYGGYARSDPASGEDLAFIGNTSEYLLTISKAGKTLGGVGISKLASAPVPLCFGDSTMRIVVPSRARSRNFMWLTETPKKASNVPSPLMVVSCSSSQCRRRVLSLRWPAPTRRPLRCGVNRLSSTA
jgi:hypothetical protein